MMPVTTSRTDTPEDIAVVGLGGLFPGAPDLGTYWRNIVSKVSAITDPPPEAWDKQLYYDVASEENDRVYCKKGGYLGPLALFDPLEHGIMPRAVEGGEPDQWLALHVARATLRDAGYAEGGAYRERTALILGKGTYANRGTISVVHHGVVIGYMLQLLKVIHPDLPEEDLQAVRDDLKRRLPRFDAETAPALIPNVTAGRIANRLDLMGPSYTIDAACASSLVAIDIAAKGLRHGEYDMALVGGMQVATPVPVLSLFCRLKALSLTETIRPFDKDADGTLLSEGIGMAVLKRRSDAERDGDRIYAFVKGTGVASDGRAVSVLAPRVEGEELALRRAYESAGVSPRTVGLIEAHGTATLVGDAVEVEALGRVFGGRDGSARTALGSVKSMIGHTMPAAGMAGFIKVALSLYQKVLPPTLGVSSPSPRLELERTPFYINTDTRPWIHGDPQHPRRAGVNAFGFGGINAHVVLEEAPTAADQETLEPDWDSEVCLFAGSSRSEVIALGEQVVSAIARDAALSLTDIAYSLHTRTPAMGRETVVLGIVATSTDDLARKLGRALPRLADPACRRIKEVGGIYFFEEPLGRTGKLAFLFPGEGAQYVNMLGDLCRHFPEVRACFDEMDRAFARSPRGFVLSDLVFPPPAFSDAEREEAERRLWQMDVAVEAVYTANHAMHALVTACGIRPDAMLGHSTGEYSAMRAAGMLDASRYEARLQEINGIYAGASAQGTLPLDARLIAVAAPRDRVVELLARVGGGVRVAMDNCRHQVVLVASRPSVAAVQDVLRASGLLYEMLPFDRPVHTPEFAEYAGTLRRLLTEALVHPAAVPLYSATSTGPYPTTLRDIHELAYQHWIRPVEFRRTVETMHADGVRVFLEVGPRGNVTAFVDDILGGRPYVAIPANVSRRSGIAQVGHMLALLAAHGVRLTLAPLFRRRRLALIDFAADTPIRPVKPLIGRVKIPTGAPELRLSSDVAARVRERVRALGPRAAAAAAPAGVVAGPVEDGRDPTPAPSTSEDPARPPTVDHRHAGIVAPAGQHAADVTLASAAAAAEDGHAHARMAAPSPLPPGDGGWTAVAQASDPVSPPVVMGAYLDTMESFLSLQQDVMALTAGVPVADRGAAAILGHAQPALPFIDSIVSSDQMALVARCTVDLDRCPLLRDHTLGRRVSIADQDLTGFPVVPFTMLMEMMAEGAAALAPHLVVTGMRAVRVYRWVGVDAGPVTLEIRAERTNDEQIAARVFELGPAGPSPVAEGVMVTGTDYPPAPLAGSFHLESAEMYRWPPERLYDEAMFHGPAFRGVCSVDRVAPAGSEATLVVLDRRSLLPGGRAAGLVTDPVLLDLPGQVIGFWASHFLERAYLVLPFWMESLSLYGPPLQPEERLTCTALTTLVGDHQVRSSMDVIRADGRLWARFEGWEDRRFDLPSAASRLLVAPATATLARRREVPAGPTGVDHGLIGVGIETGSFPTGWLSAHGGLWLRVLAANVLSRRERALWHGLAFPAKRRIEWLLGRIAAKDAVREHLRTQANLALCPADVELLPDEQGRPVVHGAWTGLVASVPLVSVSHLDGVAIAVVVDGGRAHGIGVDLERIGRMNERTARVALTRPEQQLLEGTDGPEREAWSLRLWCAKEASAKAVGRGFAEGPHAFAVQALDRQSGAVSIRYQPPGRRVLELTAFTAVDGEWVVATSVAGARQDVTT
jgi:acyl transferase domain-containing protein/phosphopantetheinyl transferase